MARIHAHGNCGSASKALNVVSGLKDPSNLFEGRFNPNIVVGRYWGRGSAVLGGTPNGCCLSFWFVLVVVSCVVVVEKNQISRFKGTLILIDTFD